MPCRGTHFAIAEVNDKLHAVVIVGFIVVAGMNSFEIHSVERTSGGNRKKEKREEGERKTCE